jgi:Domain of unknown function (DUF6457)
MTQEGAAMNALDRWAEVVCFEFSLSPDSVDARVVLDMARDVAHGVDRPAAPLTAYLLGLAVAQGHPLEATAARISELASGWDGDESSDR